MNRTKEIKTLRKEWDIHAAFKIVDTCAAEFEAETPYYYSCFSSETEVEPKTERKKVLVLGSGPIRIGQGIEFFRFISQPSDHIIWKFYSLSFF